MLVSEQVRMARGALRWSVAQLSEASGVSARTIARIEASDGVPRVNVTSIERLKVTFESQGVEFTGAPHEGPGIRLWQALGVSKGV